MRAAWLTPDEIPTGYRYVGIVVPQGGTWEAIFRGALAPLFDAENFEQYGTLTPEETAEQFREYMFNWMGLFSVQAEGDRVIGEIFWFAADVVPGNALVCDGAIYNIEDYPALFAVIGSAYGGDGVDTFGVPNVAGRMPIGVGSGTGLTPRALGDTGGAETHVLTEAELPAHDHTINHAHELTGVAEPAVLQSGTNRIALRDGQATNWPVSTHSGNSGNAGGGDAHENMPPFIGLIACIRAL